MTLFEAQHICASYAAKHEESPLFSDINFTLEEGNIYDLIGFSGSGKSTLLRVCALMMEKTHGKLFLSGKESTTFAPTAWRRQVCLVPQTPALVPGTVKDNLLLPWKLKAYTNKPVPSDNYLLELLARAELSEIELERNVSQLSGGQVARIALLRVFATKPHVLLLDEVDASLDDDSAHSIGHLTCKLVSEGLTCLRIRHRNADGFASGTFTLSKEGLSYQDNKPEGGK